MPGVEGGALTGNRLLDRLPDSDRGRLAQGMALEQCEIRQILLEAGTAIGNVWFPVDAVVSSLTTMSDGAGVEIITIGNEGMVGSPLFLGSEALSEREFCQVQVPGAVLRMDSANFVDEMAGGVPSKGWSSSTSRPFSPRSPSRWRATASTRSTSAAAGGCC
ncbi:MAG: hypothetical protein ACRDY0_07195 [Acidimicrobiales bacterium]